MTEDFQNETFVCSVKYKGHKVDVYNDDYGQCYFFKFTDKKGKVHECSCGSFNVNYETQIKDYIDYCVFDGTLLENIKKKYDIFLKEEHEKYIDLYKLLLEKIPKNANNKTCRNIVIDQWETIVNEWKKENDQLKRKQLESLAYELHNWIDDF